MVFRSTCDDTISKHGHFAGTDQTLCYRVDNFLSCVELIQLLRNTSTPQSIKLTVLFLYLKNMFGQDMSVLFSKTSQHKKYCFLFINLIHPAINLNNKI